MKVWGHPHQRSRTVIKNLGALSKGALSDCLTSTTIEWVCCG